MKLFFYFCLIGIISAGCSNNELPEKKTETSTSTHKVKNDNQQFYSNGQLKMSGELNDKGQREGVWISYFEDGTKNSESVYKEGINNGYTMVWYPNGKVRYFGDYANGKRSGSWTFYNESGEIVKTESY